RRKFAGLRMAGSIYTKKRLPLDEPIRQASESFSLIQPAQSGKTSGIGAPTYRLAVLRIRPKP
ncbi:MAG TPA: hypothetical protein VLZ84_09495, partial [Asticcacaulis sp.]|nr:hypothetical protein [Asticcacaulis sp.]